MARTAHRSPSDQVTRQFLRLRLAASLGILLLAACLALGVTAWGRQSVDQRETVIDLIDATVMSLTKVTRSFDRFIYEDGVLKRAIVRSDLRSQARTLTELQMQLKALLSQNAFAPATAELIATPGLRPIEDLSEIIAVSERIARGGQKPAIEERLGAFGVQTTSRLMPVFLRMKDAEKSASVAAGERTIHFGMASLLITILAIAAMIRLVHIPMERRILSAQARITEERRTAERASDAKTQFLATMSHEIRTPMNGILGIAELMSEADLPEKQRALVNVIRNSGTALMAIIDDVLDISKIEAGKLAIETHPTDLAQLCNEVRQLFDGQAQCKGIGLELSVQPDTADWTYNCDAKSLRQVISNLVGNAIKFTTTGKVIISLRQSDDGLKHGVEITVRDQGIGIAEEDQARIFERFEQASASTTRTFGGTGLGLSIVRKLTEAMGGTIEVQSALGQGAEFKIRLPLEPVGVCVEASVPLPVTGGDAADGARHILIAEDNEVNMMVATHFLQNAGHRVSQAVNGREAVDMAETLQPNLILMDGEMPVMGGLEATRMIRARETRLDLPRVPIIAFSANAMADNHRQAIASGMDGHVVKPFKPEELLSVVSKDWRAARDTQTQEL